MLLEPQEASELTREKYLRLLLLGPPKVGKTSCAIGTSPKKVYVINSDREDALIPARRLTSEFTYNTVHTSEKMEAAIRIARDYVKQGKIKTVVWDGLSDFSDYLADECIEQSAQQSQSGKPDGRKAWPEYHKRLQNAINRVLSIKAHVIITSHFMDFRTDDDDKSEKKKIAKVGDGIVPLLKGASRLGVAKLFADVLFLEKRSNGERYLLTDLEGVWGPGTRNLPGVTSLPANMVKVIEYMDKVDRAERKGSR